ncbi:MAG: 2-oxoglutarate dehydrogenase, E2 component, dihydrolipoamide succinyltransferase [Bacteroidetes bacterium]|nr:2-oxoglutarate dehydrogenase, E2 component, dihydrolipoamide succinyltransferase [Bacteroidota bacterium]
MDIIMPKMGESVSEGTIIKWYKQVGDSVKRDELICEISTDKVDTEIPSPNSGVLSEIKVNEGDTVDVGTVIAILDEDNKNVSKTTTGIVPEEKTEPAKSESAKSEPELKKINTSGELLEIEMPKMGESVMEGTIIKWLKKVGEHIKLDEALFEISTDKVDTEVPSPVEGTVAEIMVAEQETVDVGTVVAKISTDLNFIIPKTSKSSEVEESVVSAPASIHKNFTTQSAELTKQTSEGDRFYSPLVLSIAQTENVSFVELGKINGSGLKGRVTKKDILSYLQERKTGDTREVQTPPSGTQSQTPVQQGVTELRSSGEVEKIPMDNIRQKIMKHMIASRDTSVHVTSLVEVDMVRIDKFIVEKKEEYRQRDGINLTYMAFIADACVKALQEYPLVNSSIEGNMIIRKKYINLGIAVAVERTGLIVPNIKSANHRNLIGLAAAISDIAYRSRNKKLLPDDVTDGTFTITNYGVFGTVFGLPIINQPEVAILGVGAVVKRPTVIEADGTDTIAIRPIMALTLSHDHRLIDGMLGSLFLKYVKESLEGFDPGSI